MLLIQRKGWIAGSADESLYNAGQDILKNRYQKIAEGKLSLPDVSGGGVTEPKSNIQASYPERIFTTEVLDGF